MSTRRLTSMFAACATAILIGLTGCTPKSPPGTVMNSPAAAWKSFRAHYCVPPAEPAMKVKAALHYSRTKPRKRTNRTLMTLWGDFDSAMRMDVSASIGKLLAHIRENSDGLLVFYPADKEAYTHSNPVLGATRLGMPFPFSLEVLASVLVGDFSDLAPKKFADGARTAKGQDGFVYELNDGLVTRITLDVVGRPIAIEGMTTKRYANARSWRLEINRYEEAQAGEAVLPDKVTLALDNGETGVLHIKSRELMLTAWPAKSLQLTLPDEVPVTPLDNGYVRKNEDGIPVVYEDK